MSFCVVWNLCHQGKAFLPKNILLSYTKLICFAQVYLKVGKPLVYAALNGYKGTLLTYGQTGTGNECNIQWLSVSYNSARVVAGCTVATPVPRYARYKLMYSFRRLLDKKKRQFWTEEFNYPWPHSRPQSFPLLGFAVGTKEHLLGRKKDWKSLRMTQC